MRYFDAKRAGAAKLSERGSGKREPRSGRSRVASACQTSFMHLYSAALSGEAGCCAKMEGEAVAWLEIRTPGDDPDGECYPNVFNQQLMHADILSSIEICGNEQFILGRDPAVW
jgi:hypothetical protein